MKFLRVLVLENKNCGLTFIEIIIVIAILTILASLGLIFGIDFYKNYGLDAERNIVLSILQKSRGQAQNNINQSPHGIYFQSDNYVLFQGASYTSRNSIYDQIIPKNPAINVSGLSEIVFEQLNGRPQIIGDIVLDNAKRSLTISINNEGGINW